MSTDTVTVGSKLPHGVLLQLCKMSDVMVPVLGGGMRKVQEATRLPKTYKVHGVAIYKGQFPDYRIVGRPNTGFALTPGIPKDFWDEWLKQNRDNDFVVNGLIFAHVEEASTVDQAREHMLIPSGMEPIDPARIGNWMGDGQFKVATSDAKTT